MGLAVEDRPTDSLIPYARNARTHSDAQVQQIAASIREFGWTNPILVDGENGVVAGHGRLLAARSLGMATVPCMELAGLSEAQRRAYVLADNQLALNAGWDTAMLKLELRDLEALGFELGVIGFSDDDLASLMPNAGLTDQDAAPDLPPVAFTRPGDVWLCGGHRVACGDSTTAEAVRAAVGAGAKVDCLWTDPPYNVAYETAAGAIQNDDLDDAAFRAFLRGAFAAAFAVMKKGAPAYVAHADTEGLNNLGAFAEVGFRVSSVLVWRKNALVMGRSDYQWQHESILYGWKPGAAHRWYGGRKNTTLLEGAGQLVTDNGDGTLTLRFGDETAVISGTDLQMRTVETSIFSVEKPKRSSVHPTMKPVELISRMLRNSSRHGDLVLDLFGGSGSTLIACEMLGRLARLVELDARYCDVIVQRWQDFTGRIATRESDGRGFAAAGAPLRAA